VRDIAQNWQNKAPIVMIFLKEKEAEANGN
jgi:hypothetical protein